VRVVHDRQKLQMPDMFLGKIKNAGFTAAADRCEQNEKNCANELHDRL